MTDIHIIQLYANGDAVLESLKVERDGFYYYIKIGGLTVHGAPGLPDALECNDSGFWYATSDPTKPLLGTVQVDTTHTGPIKITLLDMDSQPEEPVLPTNIEQELMAKLSISFDPNTGHYLAWDETGADTIIKSPSLVAAILARQLYCTTYLEGKDLTSTQKLILEYIRGVAD